MLPDTTPDSKSDTFTSVLPGVEDVLECMYKLAEGGDTSIDEVVTKAREIQAKLNAMKAVATALPGGHISAQMIGELSNVFDAQAAERRELLKQFTQTSTPMAERIAGEETKEN